MFSISGSALCPSVPSIPGSEPCPAVPRSCRRSRTACPRAVPGCPPSLRQVAASVRPGPKRVAGLRFRHRNPIPCFPELLFLLPPRLPQAVSRTVYRNARREGQSQIGSRSFVFAGVTCRNPGDPLGDHFDHLAALQAPVVRPRDACEHDQLGLAGFHGPDRRGRDLRRADSGHEDRIAGLGEDERLGLLDGGENENPLHVTGPLRLRVPRP